MNDVAIGISVVAICLLGILLHVTLTLNANAGEALSRQRVELARVEPVEPQRRPTVD